MIWIPGLLPKHHLFFNSTAGSFSFRFKYGRKIEFFKNGVLNNKACVMCSWCVRIMEISTQFYVYTCEVSFAQFGDFIGSFVWLICLFASGLRSPLD